MHTHTHMLRKCRRFLGIDRRNVLLVPERVDALSWPIIEIIMNSLYFIFSNKFTAGDRSPDDRDLERKANLSLSLCACMFISLHVLVPINKYQILIVEAPLSSTGLCHG